jgi:NADH-quinone oxidoreductase subunit J
MSALGTVYFGVCALLAVIGALAVVVAKNPIRGAMGLLLLILSMAGLFLALHAQFLAAIQLIVYAGAIVVLFLFVIMLLGPSAATPSDRRGLVTRALGGGLFAVTGMGAIALVANAMIAAKHPFALPDPEPTFGGIDAFGSSIFADAIVPFEVSSALLMVAVIAAIAIARGRQGVASLTKNEQEAAAIGQAPRLGVTGGASGVYSHEIHVHDPSQGEEPSA